MTGRMLIAGIGNVFLGDDGFGIEVARRLVGVELPDWASVADYGISRMHLAYDLADGFETAILIDAAPRGGPPSTVYVIEPERRGEQAAALPGGPLPGGPTAGGPLPGGALPGGALAGGALFDAHGMQPDVVRCPRPARRRDRTGADRRLRSSERGLRDRAQRAGDGRGRRGRAGGARPGSCRRRRAGAERAPLTLGRVVTCVLAYPVR